MISRRNLFRQGVASAAALTISSWPAMAATNTLSLQVNKRFAAYMAIQEEKRRIYEEVDRIEKTLPALALDSPIDMARADRERLREEAGIIALHDRYDALYDERTAIWDEIAAIEDRSGNADLIGARILIELDAEYDLDKLGSADLQTHERLFVAILQSMAREMTGTVRRYAGETLATLEGFV